MRYTVLRRFQANLLHSLIKKLTVFSLIYRLAVCTDQLNIVFFQDAMSIKVQRTVEGCLPPHGWQDGIGLFLRYDLFNHAPVDGLNIGRISHNWISHDGRRIRIHQYDSKAFFLQSLTSLRARVVEFTSLANHYRARSDY